MSTIVYSDTLNHFENTSQAMDHFSSKSTQTGDSKTPWGIIVGIGVIVLIGYAIYASIPKNTPLPQKSKPTAEQNPNQTHSNEQTVTESTEEPMSETW